VRQGQETFKWLIFDGPIDAIWIEDMNSVLDDSMLLCLGNGERVKLNLSMRIICEVSDMNAASLATVSRVGVIYVPEDAVGYIAYIKGFLINSFVRDSYELFAKEVCELSVKLFCEFLPGLVKW
jgi:dynein heavy chain